MFFKVFAYFSESQQIRSSSSNISLKPFPNASEIFQKTPKFDPKGAPEASRRRLGRRLASLGALLAALGTILGRSWNALGRSWALLGALGTLLGPSWDKLGHSWLDLRTSKGRFWSLPSYFKRFLSNPSGEHSERRPKAVQEQSEKITKTKSSSAG